MGETIKNVSRQNFHVLLRKTTKLKKIKKIYNNKNNRNPY